jgi:hypothetical protein
MEPLLPPSLTLPPLAVPPLAMALPPIPSLAPPPLTEEAPLSPPSELSSPQALVTSTTPRPAASKAGSGVPCESERPNRLFLSAFRAIRRID